MEDKEPKQEQETKVNLDDIPEYQDKLSQSIIKYCREKGETDEQILAGLKAFL